MYGRVRALTAARISRSHFGAGLRLIATTHGEAHHGLNQPSVASHELLYLYLSEHIANKTFRYLIVNEQIPGIRMSIFSLVGC